MAWRTGGKTKEEIKKKKKNGQRRDLERDMHVDDDTSADQILSFLFLSCDGRRTRHASDLELGKFCLQLLQISQVLAPLLRLVVTPHGPQHLVALTIKR
jgi:hypothetical protein